MIKSTNHSNTRIFWLELLFAIFIPFIICWRITPTNILNHNFLFGILEDIGFYGSVLIFFGGIPVGIIGIKKAKKMEKRRISTIILSLLNLSAAIIDIAMFLLILFTALFGGGSV